MDKITFKNGSQPALNDASLNQLQRNMENAVNELGKEINKKITNLSTYSKEEVKTGETWIDGKPIYRKIITGSLTKSGTNTVKSLSDIGYDTIIKLDLITKNTDPITSQFYNNTTVNIRCYIVPSSKVLKAEVGSEYPKVPLDYIITLEYTKTTD